MSTINDTDLLLVNRGGTSYQCAISDSSKILDTDIVLVNQGGTSYQMAWSDKSKLVDGTTMLINRSGSSYQVSGPDVLSAAGGGALVDLNGMVTRYQGNGGELDVINGIDLVNNKGMVWVKGLTGNTDHQIWDTPRNRFNVLMCNLSSAQFNGSPYGLTQWLETGFHLLNKPSDNEYNAQGAAYTSYTFSAQPQYFDVVKYTGNSSTGESQTIIHSLGAEPGCIIAKAYNAPYNWYVYHSSLPTAYKNFMIWNGQDLPSPNASIWGESPDGITDSIFTVAGGLNNNNEPYIAYLWAKETENVKCGQYTGEDNDIPTNVECGWKPQFVMIKGTTEARDWSVYDSQRLTGTDTDGNQFSEYVLNPNQLNAQKATIKLTWTPTGFRFEPNDYSVSINKPGYNFVYVAIRAGNQSTLTTNVETTEPGPPTQQNSSKHGYDLYDIIDYES